MREYLPEVVWPLEFARLGKVVAGELSVARVPRLAELAECAGGLVRVEWRFELDEAGRARISGALRADVALLCQRCLEEMAETLTFDTRLMVTHGDDLPSTLPEGFEALEVEGGRFELVDLVGEELLLALPSFPRHPIDACQAPPQVSPGGDASRPSTSKAFAALAALASKD